MDRLAIAALERLGGRTIEMGTASRLPDESLVLANGDTESQGHDGVRPEDRLAVSESEGDSTPARRLLGSVAEGALQVNDHHVRQDDSGSTSEPGIDSGDIQPHKTGVQSVPEADQEGVRAERDPEVPVR